MVGQCKSCLPVYKDCNCNKLFVAGVVVLGGVWIGKQICWLRKYLQMKEKAAEKRQEAEKSKEELSEKLQTEDEDELAQREAIVTKSLSELSAALKSGELTPVQVLQAFQAKAMETTKELNCVTEPILEAESLAEDLEEEDKGGLLYGIPVSVKENVNIKGYDSTMGFAKFIDMPAESDSVVVQVLRQQGAIPFVKTNVPQSLLSYSCSNTVYGKTTHPTDPSRAPGGSSGGEGALLKRNGSPLGIGTDIAGSVRIPAQMSGVCALRPSEQRISNKGIKGCAPGQRGLSGGIGIMSRDVEGVAMAMRALWTPLMFELDCNVAPMEFNEEIYSGKKALRIGYCNDDGFFTPIPSCQRAVNLSKSALEAAGHTLIPFQPPRSADAIPNLAWKLLHGDGNRTWLNFFKGEPMDRDMAFQIRTWIKPRLFRMLMRPFVSSRIYDTVEAHAGVRSVQELWQTQAKAAAYKFEYLAEWRKLNLDVLICPAFYVTAVSNENSGRIQYAASSTVIFNLLNFPAGVVPVTNVTEGDDNELATTFPINDSWDKLARDACKDSAGLPVGVQCVALQYQDELCLRLMKEVETTVKTL
ncbi:fatty-acid amide hydrolase 1-like [Ptychodera flava]|uniref:fatty-acid amide hydrolase 1-like n=1 Tax=Ptychodera flava TaxID=63121 RepID=UPI00396A4F9E